MVKDDKLTCVRSTIHYKKVAGAVERGVFQTCTSFMRSVCNGLHSVIKEVGVAAFLGMLPVVNTQNSSSLDPSIFHNSTGITTDSSSNGSTDNTGLILGNIATAVFLIALCCGVRRSIKGPRIDRVGVAPDPLTAVVVLTALEERTDALSVAKRTLNATLTEVA